RGPKAVMKGLGAGALWAGKRLRQKTRCATRAFKANKGRARVTQAAKAFKKDPVYIASGEVIESRTDIELGQTIPMVFERTYRTASLHAGLVGRGWQDSWSEVATVSQDEGGIHVTITLAQGYDIDFTFGLGATVVYCAEYPEFKLLRRHNGFHLWHRDSQTWRAFTVKQGDQLLLSAITDNHQNRIDFLRDPKGYLRKIQHSDGIELLLVWQGEFLRQVQRID
ncbi:DUF6531 domain-containing protein, partial [Pectobacterium brasiliense]|uniref:DUF6531 domain-containing protein n=1 Tax=Pectobacterium brasiliense TaxID=180957 RepID=UPI001F4586BE